MWDNYQHVLNFFSQPFPFGTIKIQYLFDGHKALPFPFQSVGFGCEGNPLPLDILKKLSFDISVVTTAKEQGVDLLVEKCLGLTINLN
ncbi:hypothetical protein DVH24_033129 [Malus domestica]|uniref:Uncharacterized protein n=1 Tax=Malus domestica TaxID=3750 RepID=A0A498JEJ1_MALDO|nr:hypothetical protein DVH24_033129 [Malus domestica]